MKKAKAIGLLKLAVPIKALTQQEYADFVEAVNMGMDALKQPTSPNTIDRKAALDALRRCQTYLYDARDPELKIELSSAEAAINNLSTIQPEKAQLSPQGTTSDLISRQAAIDALAEQMPTPYTPDGSHPADEQIFQVQEVYVDCITTIKLLPTIQPEPKEGQWIRTDCGLDVECKCSRCGYKDFVQPRDEYWFKRNYCPNCGAKMTISTK